MRHLSPERTGYFLIAAVLIVVLVLAIFRPWSAAPSGTRGATALYTSDVYGVSFEYPADWRKAENAERFFGETGYVEVSVADGSLTLDNVLPRETGRIPNPYGSHPSVETLTVDGEPAGLTMPSADQVAEMNNQAALIASFPEPITVDGKEYPYLVLWADQYHIRGIVNTLKFNQ